MTVDLEGSSRNLQKSSETSRKKTVAAVPAPATTTASPSVEDTVSAARLRAQQIQTRLAEQKRMEKRRSRKRRRLKKTRDRRDILQNYLVQVEIVLGMDLIKMI